MTEEGFLATVAAPLLQIIVHLANELVATTHTDYTQLTVKRFLHL
jgi:hypothetical protein